MQFFNTHTPLSAIDEISRFHKLKMAYPELTDIRESIWQNTIYQAKALNALPGTILFSGTTTCNNFMLILKGTIRIYQTAEDGREITLYRVEAGDLCILSLNSLLKNKSFNAIAIAESNIEALAISADSFNELMDGSKTFRDYVLSTLTERLCETICIIQSTAFMHLNMRLACMLGSLFERKQSSTIKITHQELAFELGTTREVISRILKDFEKHNCVVLSRGHIKLASAEGLKWFSHPA